MNTATQMGLAAVNKARQGEVELKAQGLINRIKAKLDSIKSNKEAIAAEQAELKKLAEDVISQEVILGQAMSGELNPNQVTIANAIKKLNDDRQKSVEAKSQGYVNRIDGLNKTNAKLDEEIAELRKELTALAADVVTPEVIVGSSQ